MSRIVWIVSLWVVGQLWCLQAQAVEDFSVNRSLPWYFDATKSVAGKSAWQLDLGLEVGWEPDYVGSDDNELEAFPLLALRYRWRDNWRFQLTPGTISGAWDLSESTLMQLVIEYEEGREASETEDLKLLEDGANTTEAELTLAQRIGSSAFVYATYQPEIQDRGKGVVWFVGTGYQWRLNDRLLLTPTIDVSWGDAEHMQTEFGVDSQDAALLGIDSYHASGGLKSSSATMNFQWNATPKISVLGSLGVEYYFSEAADSPLLKELGDRVNTEFEMSLIYSF